MTLEDFLRTEAMNCSVKNAEQAERAWREATAAERERCAKIAEGMTFTASNSGLVASCTGQLLAEYIRAGEEPK